LREKKEWITLSPVNPLTRAMPWLLVIGRLLASTTLQLLQTLTTSGEVLSVACAPNGRIIAAACGDGTVKAWTVDAEPH